MSEHCVTLPVTAGFSTLVKQSAPKKLVPGLRCLADRIVGYFAAIATIFSLSSTPLAISATVSAALAHSAFAPPSFAQPAIAQPVQAQPTPAASRSVDQPLDRFESSIKLYEVGDKLDPPPSNSTVFVGSSTFALWGKDLERDFKQFKAVNRGFGGSTIPEVNHYADRVVVKYKPAKVVFYAGTNDIADGHSGERVLEDFRTFCQKVHGALPKTDIYFISISMAPSRVQFAREYESANRQIKEFIATQKPYLHFIDVRSVMLDDTGHLKSELFRADNLHMKKAGYDLWVPIIARSLQSN